MNTNLLYMSNGKVTDFAGRRWALKYFFFLGLESMSWKIHLLQMCWQNQISEVENETQSQHRSVMVINSPLGRQWLGIGLYLIWESLVPLKILRNAYCLLLNTLLMDILENCTHGLRSNIIKWKEKYTVFWFFFGTEEKFPKGSKMSNCDLFCKHNWILWFIFW